MKNKTLENRLKEYTAIASSLLAIEQTKAQAQIIYTDIVPDESVHNSFFNLDLNNDGIVDFRFEEEPFTTIISTYDGLPISTSYWFSNFIIPNLQNKTIADAGSSRPAQLLSGDIISQNKNWITGADMQSAYFNGPWKVDSLAYSGLRLTIGTNTYYGWARIKITLDEMILYDYAYNAFPNQSIHAGEGIVNSVSEIQNKNSISVYPNPVKGNLTIQLNTQITKASVTITNTLGEAIQKIDLLTRTQVIDFSTLPAGIYFIRVQAENGSVVKKVIKI